MKSQKTQFFENSKGSLSSRGITPSSILVTIALTVAIILIMAIFLGQQKEKTEKTVFGTLWERFFPSKMESVVIPGTSAGAGCATIQIDGANMLAQAVLDCWNQGKTFGDNIECCYNIDPKNIKGTIDKNMVLQEMMKKRKGRYTDDFVWNLGTPYMGSGTAQFAVCFDYNVFVDEVYITFDPKSDCS